MRRQIQDMDTDVFVSAASVWEIAAKYRIGTLPEANAVAVDVPKWIIKAGFHPLDIKPEHAQLAGSRQITHKDPFNRMLVAQSKLEKIPLATVDKMLSMFPIQLVQ